MWQKTRDLHVVVIGAGRMDSFPGVLPWKVTASRRTCLFSCTDSSETSLECRWERPSWDSKGLPGFRFRGLWALGLPSRTRRGP